MEDNTPKTFKIGGDDQENETVMQSELQELKIEKLNQRVMLLTILIPCMIGVILIISYLDIKDRVKRTQSTGTIGVQKLSKDLDSKFSSLSLEQAKLKEMHDKKLPALEKSAAFLQTRLKKIQASIKDMEESKTDREELAKAVNDFNARFATFMEHEHSQLDDLLAVHQELSAKTEALSNQVGEMAETYTGLSEKLTLMKADLADLAATKIDKEALDLAMKLKEIGIRQATLDITGAMGKRIDALQRQVNQMKNTPGSAPAPQPQPAETGTKPEATQPDPGQTTDSIEEQSIE